MAVSTVILENCLVMARQIHFSLNCWPVQSFFFYVILVNLLIVSVSVTFGCVGWVKLGLHLTRRDIIFYLRKWKKESYNQWVVFLRKLSIFC